ncbi:hypothetical protein KUCAC02_017719 [Chaenocephalus aceratus]|uniref:Uncharacterized protein n=1 Tax=Chaenocephalus aceratus TaxID=36190 RepID=A0ACB9W226_CHAAC|nr:hypothetical protein KUCAC02_017719 [Chaenocephalus aceratus]
MLHFNIPLSLIRTKLFVFPFFKLNENELYYECVKFAIASGLFTQMQ